MPFKSQNWFFHTHSPVELWLISIPVDGHPMANSWSHISWKSGHPLNRRHPIYLYICYQVARWQKKPHFIPTKSKFKAHIPNSNLKQQFFQKNKLLKKYVHTYKHPLRPVDSETGIYSNSKLNGTRTTGVRYNGLEPKMIY